MLPFHDRLMRTNHFDPEMAALADRHYTRQTPGARQFAGNGQKIVLRDAAGEVLFVWLRQLVRWDGRAGGFNCQLFRNESARRASEIILEAEQFALEVWGAGVAFTYVDPRKIRLVKVHGEPVPGFSFLKAGWTRIGFSTRKRKVLFEKVVM